MGNVVSPFDPRIDVGALLAADHVIACRPAADDNERQLCARIRNEVFVKEQGIFTGSDRDAFDDDPETIHIVGLVGALVGGTVRIYRLDEPGLWKGDRLAVLPGLRKLVLGKRLVQFAVRTAGTLGGKEMRAFVQLPNVSFFERLGWERYGDPGAYHGVPHQQMSIPLLSEV